MDEIKTQIFNIAELNPATYNPRKELRPGDPEFEALTKSIQTFGYVDLVVVNTRTGNTVVSGHQRLNCLKYLGETKVECVVVDLSEEEEKALNIAMNKIAGSWDMEKLKDILSDLDVSGIDMTLTGFDDEELKNLIGDVPLGDEDFDLDEELQKPTYSKAGDVWHLGEHIIVCGDSTKSDTYTTLLGEGLADIVLTDPPYMVDVEKTAGKIKNDNLGDAEADEFLTKAFTCMYDCLKDNGTIYVWHADGKGLLFRNAFASAGFSFITCCIWIKDALVLGRSPFQWIHEPCLMGKKGEDIDWYGSDNEGTIWNFDRPKKSEKHPTTKPVPLLVYQIQNSSKKGDIVLDPFLGSGSTLIACCETGRICRGVELDPKFVDVEVERYISYMGGYTDVYVERDGVSIPYVELEKPE